MYYVPVEQRRFQDFRIEFLTIARRPQKWCLIFERITSGEKLYKKDVAISDSAFITIHPLQVYYLIQLYRGLTTPGIGPVFSTPRYFHRGHGMGNFNVSLFRWVRPILWSAAKAVGRETLRTGGKVLTDIAERKSTDNAPSAGDIACKHVTESAQNVIG